MPGKIEFWKKNKDNFHDDRFVVRLTLQIQIQILYYYALFTTLSINSITEITSPKERKKYNKYIIKIKCAQ